MIGHDFIFGKDRSGNAELLKKYAKEDVHSFVPHVWVTSKVCKQFWT